MGKDIDFRNTNNPMTYFLMLVIGLINKKGINNTIHYTPLFFSSG